MRLYVLLLSTWLTRSVCVAYCERSDRSLSVAYTVRKHLCIAMFTVIHLGLGGKHSFYIAGPVAIYSEQKKHSSVNSRLH